MRTRFPHLTPSLFFWSLTCGFTPRFNRERIELYQGCALTAVEYKEYCQRKFCKLFQPEKEEPQLWIVACLAELRVFEPNACIDTYAKCAASGSVRLVSVYDRYICKGTRLASRSKNLAESIMFKYVSKIRNIERTSQRPDTPIFLRPVRRTNESVRLWPPRLHIAVLFKELRRVASHCL